jgi:acetyltransferase
LRTAQRHPLDSIFAPRSIAIIGATEKENSVGRSVVQNMVNSGFQGKVYPVNPKRPTVLGLPAFPSIDKVPDKVDLAVVVTPSTYIPGIIGECARVGIKGAVVISAGFKETGPAGEELERQLLAEARKGDMRVIGPNCLGVMVPRLGLNVTFAGSMARPGNLGFISQSGALCTAILDWSLKENVGFSSFISIGSMLDVNWGDLIYYLGDDPNTKSIVMYMESIGDARTFLSAAREVALTKPIIVIKVGRTQEAARAAASHTGSLTGSDEVLDAAFRRVGVLRVNTIAELFDMSEVLAKQPRPPGPRLVVLTNAGGPGVLATDALISSGGKLAEVSKESMDAFNALLPAHWSHNNPIDILGDAGPIVYAKAIEIASKDPGNDGLLVILTPQAMTDPTGTAEQLKPYARLEGKPILASWMGGLEIEKGNQILNEAGIPTYYYPDRAARAFSYMWSYADTLHSLYETPPVGGDWEDGVHRKQVEKALQAARKAKRTLLSEVEATAVLAGYGIPTLSMSTATTAEQAAQLADEVGYPVVLKLYSKTITHKTDVGGVKLNLRNAAAVKKAFAAIQKSVTEKAGREHFLGVSIVPMISFDDAYEVILGSSIDQQFGPVMLFGAGGQLVEVFKDRALALPPLNAILARRMMEQTKIYTALKGVRGRKAVDLAKLEQVLVQFSRLIVEQPWIKEIDINPMLVSSEKIVALDARIVLHSPELTPEQLPRPAIRPYPVQYMLDWKLKDGTVITLRPIRPEDEPLMVKFHSTLSERSVYYRYFSHLKLDERITHERLIRICFNDYDREIALVVDHRDPRSGEQEIIGVGRLSKKNNNEGEFALLVSDRYQDRGLGTQLLRMLVNVSKSEKLSRLSGKIMAGNKEMQHVCKKVGFSVHSTSEGECEAQFLL